MNDEDHLDGLDEYRSEVISKDLSVKDLVHESLEKIDLAFDLAYAGLKLDSQQIEGEVSDLHAEIDFLQSRLLRKILLAARSTNTEEREGLLHIIIISNQIGRLANCALRMVQLRRFLETDLLKDLQTKQDPGTENILVYQIISVTQEPDVVDIDEMEQNTGRMLLAVRRHRKFLFELPEKVLLYRNDVLICRTLNTDEEDFKHFMELRGVEYKLLGTDV